MLLHTASRNSTMPLCRAMHAAAHMSRKPSCSCQDSLPDDASTMTCNSVCRADAAALASLQGQKSHSNSSKQAVQACMPGPVGMAAAATLQQQRGASQAAGRPHMHVHSARCCSMVRLSTQVCWMYTLPAGHTTTCAGCLLASTCLEIHARHTASKHALLLQQPAASCAAAITGAQAAAALGRNSARHCRPSLCTHTADGH
jgi:hypothetical protein